MRHESGLASVDRGRQSSRATYSENLRKRIVEQYGRALVPSAIAVAQGVTFGTVRSALAEAGIKIPGYLSWNDSEFGKVERCVKCGHETS